MRRFNIVQFVLLLSFAFGCGAPEQLLEIQPQLVGTDALFIGSVAVSEDIAWLSGSMGTYTFTTDGGDTWKTGRVPGADSLQFRDVHAFDGEYAFLLSAGDGSESRIYHTSNGGDDWELQWTNDDPNGFFDCIDFWDRESGLLYGDSIDGKLMIYRTEDGGDNWTQIDPATLPPALPGEGGFAASGTCLRTHGDSTAWIGTGAGTRPRVLRTVDRGATWSVSEIDLPAGPNRGIFSLSFQDALNGIAVGGDLSQPDAFTKNVATTNDGGRSWKLGGQPLMKGVAYGSSFVPNAKTPTIVITGPSGANYSVDNGLTWNQLDTLNYWTAAFASPSAGWIAGTGGTVMKVVLPD